MNVEQALVLQFGEPIRVEKEPGLKFKLPFVQNVRISTAACSISTARCRKSSPLTRSVWLSIPSPASDR
jgi:regulator of protease activity HflC (stomatin/prohibitin superfamily)